MNDLLRFLKDRRELLLYYAASIAIVLLVPALAGAELRLMHYLALLLSVCLCGLLAVDFFCFRRRRRLLRSLSAGLLSLDRVFPTPVNATEDDLFPLIRSLSADCSALAKRLEHAQQEQLGYYTLWIHQIKTPIAAMRLLLDRPGAADSTLLRQELFRVEQYADLALRYAKLTDIASDLVIKDCSVLDAERECVKKYALLFVYRHLTVELPKDDLIVMTDRRWFLFIIEQLLSNAAKYTKAGGSRAREILVDEDGAKELLENARDGREKEW